MCPARYSGKLSNTHGGGLEDASWPSVVCGPRQRRTFADQLGVMSTDKVLPQEPPLMIMDASCPNGHRASIAPGNTTCPQCAAPLYTSCPNGHHVWLTQKRCPTCGVAVGAAGQTGTIPSWPTPSAVSQLPIEERATAEGALRPGERLLWCGRPDPAVRFTKADLFLVPFSIMWAGFTVFWEAGVASSGAPVFFVAWGIPFVAMGLYITIGRFIWKARRKRQTTYLLTDQRAVVLTSDRRLAEAPWAGAPKQVYRHRDGRHVDVVFDSAAPVRSPLRSQAAMYTNTGMDFFARRTIGVAFFDVADGEALLGAMAQPLV